MFLKSWDSSIGVSLTQVAPLRQHRSSLRIRGGRIDHFGIRQSVIATQVRCVPRRNGFEADNHPFVVPVMMSARRKSSGMAVLVRDGSRGSVFDRATNLQSAVPYNRETSPPNSSQVSAMSEIQRRSFLRYTASSLGLSGLLQSLGPLSADEIKIDRGIARFSSEIEPLVEFLESTPRDEIIAKTAKRVQNGLSYRELLAALLLAGVRNVQPRPSVGFKFHAVLVVNSAHLASMSGSDDERWLPIFWAIDNFKSSQARDEREGNWSLPAVDEANVPPAHKAAKALRRALDQWDEEAADVAVTSMVRNFGANEVFAVLSEYAARDFRSIGHKVIYLSNGFRTLQTIGWDYAEPVMRSLVYAMLNHNGEPNPSLNDLAADRPGRFNRELQRKFRPPWNQGKIDDRATVELIRTLHEVSPEEASEQLIQIVNSGVGIQSVWDGLFASAGELLMRQRGIVALHAVTTTNAIHHAFQNAADDKTRQFLLLQNASFLPMFREAARGRGKLADRHIDDWRADQVTNQDAPVSHVDVPEIFAKMGSNRDVAANEMFAYLSRGGAPISMVDYARRLVFLKGNDSHDYKFSSAALEDYRVLTPQWRNRFLAASTYQLRAATDTTRPLVEEIESAFA